MTHPVRTTPGTVLLVSLACLMAASQAQAPAWRSQLEAAGGQFISARTLQAMLDQGEALVLVDAQDEVWYTAGHLGFRRILVMPGGDKEWAAEGLGTWGRRGAEVATCCPDPRASLYGCLGPA
ncbi:MAG TPA: hypothetical protein VIH59_02680 [Candidatus Tectomicrobia bacterium]|jgi:hypothetical protein